MKKQFSDDLIDSHALGGLRTVATNKKACACM